MAWLVLPAVLVGTVLQRICGTGVGLLVAPVFALLLGGADGVLLTNMTTFVSATMLTVAMRREADWATWARLFAWSLVGTVPGALLVRALPAAVLQVVVGGVVLLAMAVILTSAAPRRRRGPGTGVAAGIAAGLLNVTAGVAAPAVVLFSRVTGWDQRAYAATTQPLFMSLAVTSVGAKLLLGAAHPAHLPSAWLFLGIAAAVLVGLPLGARLGRVIAASTARTLSLLLAGAGAVLAVARGVAGLI